MVVKLPDTYYTKSVKNITGKNLSFPIYVEMVFGCLFNVSDQTGKKMTFSSKIHKVFLANIRNDCVISVIRK